MTQLTDMGSADVLKCDLSSEFDLTKGVLHGKNRNATLLVKAYKETIRIKTWMQFMHKFKIALVMNSINNKRKSACGKNSTVQQANIS